MAPEPQRDLQARIASLVSCELCRVELLDSVQKLRGVLINSLSNFMQDDSVQLSELIQAAAKPQFDQKRRELAVDDECPHGHEAQ